MADLAVISDKWQVWYMLVWLIHASFFLKKKKEKTGKKKKLPYAQAETPDQVVYGKPSPSHYL